MKMDLLSLSRLMSFILRHAPEVYVLTPDDEGWVDLDKFIAGLSSQRGFESVTLEDVTAAIESGDKRRHEIKDGKIRAMYGHSIDKKVQHKAVKPPAILFHGTSSHRLPDISNIGLKPMSRQYVHLSTDPKTAWTVGSRHGDNTVIIKILATEANEAGVQFYNPWEIIWLSDEVPTKFIELA